MLRFLDEFQVPSHFLGHGTGSYSFNFCTEIVVCIWQMLTTSRDRFEMILSEVPVQHRSNLVQVTKYQAGQNCPVSTVHYSSI